MAKSEKYISSSNLNHAVIEPFLGNTALVYLSRKVERLVAGLYLVTTHLASEEPLKRAIRATGLTTLSKVADIAPPKSSSVNVLLPLLHELHMLVSVTREVKIISEANTELLQRECRELVRYIRGVGSTGEVFSLELPAEYFAVEESPEKNGVPQNKGQLSVKDKERKSQTSSSGKTRGEAERRQVHRTEQLLSLIKEKGRITVRDAAEEIQDCSEKTLQRELLRLVSKGKLRKEGERRWSTYVLS